MILLRRLLSLALLLLPVALPAELVLGPLFQDGMVLQQGETLRVFGQATPGSSVTVKFKSQQVSATVLPSGHWLALLQPEPVSAEPAEMVVESDTTVTIRDVLVGEVWLASGQSNMAWQVSRSDNAEAEIAAANRPLIREFKVPQTVATTPQRHVGGQWTAASPQTVGDFSAVAYYFARELQDNLHVPIGIINSSWGGTQIESWISEPVLKSLPQWPDIVAAWEQRLAEYPAAVSKYQDQLRAWQEAEREARAANRPFTRRRPRRPEGEGSRWQPAGLYNAMIAPLVPYTIRGFIWYQGETNAPRAEAYATLFPALIRQWRADFALQPLPFYFVQLANLERSVDPTGEEWAFLRESQTKALAEPHTGMAVTIDIGNPNDIHPTNKQDVGRRLARLALNRTYGKPMVDEGPTFTGATLENGEVRITYRSAAGLEAAIPGLPGFELAGSDGAFHAADARIDGETVVLRSAAVPAPVSVRYAWHTNPPSSLRNAAGLPAAPFRATIGN